MLAFLLSGDGTVVAASTTRAQLPLLLAQAINLSVVAVDQAAETDAAQDITVFMGAALIPVDQATETDTGQDITVVVAPGNQFVSVDQATETDEAQDITVFVPTGPVFITIDQAEETDVAFTISYAFAFMRPVTLDTLAIVSVTESDLELVPVVPL